jgi:probable HAF family extracellular repeat protein
MAYALNDSNLIAGTASAPSNTTLLAGLWTNRATPPVLLATFGGTAGEARSINNTGQIVGDAEISPSNDRIAALWTNSASPPVSLGTLGGGVTSSANGINSHGQIIGASHEQPFAVIHGALWTNSASPPVDLPSLGGSNSDALAINDLGQIVGDAFLTTNISHACLWTNPASPPIDLGTLPGPYSNSAALSINNLGQIVGSAATNPAGTALSRALYWPSRVSPPLDLNNLVANNTGMVLVVASAINNLGEICGAGLAGGHTNAFVLVVTPTIQSIKVTGQNVAVSFPTLSGAVYDVQSATNVVNPAWSTIASNLTSTGGILTNTDPGAAPVLEKFYRVGVQQ